MSFSTIMRGSHHIGIPTNDIKASVDFYKLLGFTVNMETVMPDGTPFVFLQLGNITVETYQNNAAAGRDGAVDHIALETTDIDAAFAEAKAAGFKMLNDEVGTAPLWNGMRYFFIEGPNKERVEFCQQL